ncbi:hypothetical protein DWF00_09330 [Bosea caraganae]|uniref:YfhO family protein n=1 Tax=Bosea caraganae TaxID=2763117 RepID=A0A370LB46_9HYPH|nr:hypothetical protein DWF00_09330 [Bosea caraganae]RDJ29204.1 hypothetical protein DWE98_01105 [Bosea caraganae]
MTIPFDAKAHFQAQIQFLAQALHSGQSPFWNHNVFGGSPQVADPQSLIFSPAILLALISPSPSFREVDAYILAHLLAGGLAMLMYFRDRGWHPAGGLLAALVFAFGASAAWRVQHVGQIASLAFFAIAFWLTARMLQRGSLLSGALAGLAAGLMVLEPDQVALLGGYVIIGMVVAHWISGGWPAVRATFVPSVVAAIAGFATILVPLLLTWLFAEATTRPEIDFTVAARGSLHPISLLSAFIADLFGARDPNVEFWGPYNAEGSLYLSQNMAQVYMGALPVLLLIAPGLTRGWLWDKAVRPLSLLFLFVVLFALGRYTPLFHVVYDYLPGVKQFRRPADATFLIGALGAVLSGYVLHRLLSEENLGSLKRDLALGGAALAALIGVGLVAALQYGHLPDAWWPSLSAGLWFAAAGALVLALTRWRQALGPVASVLLVTGVVSADLRVNNGPNESTALSPELYDVLRPETKNETIRLLKTLVAQPAGSPRRDRVELLGMGFEWPNASMVHGFDHTLGYNPLRLADFSDAVGTGDGISRWGERKFTALFPSYRCRLADLLGLRYIATRVPIDQVDHKLREDDLKLVAFTGDGYIYENPRALPRAQFVAGWQLADFEGMKSAGQWPDTDPQQVVLLDTVPPDAVPEGAMTANAEVRLTRYANTEVEITVTTDKPGFVVLNDVWHPWWRAELDGTEAEILKANVLFRAVQVPAGSHKVRFSFHPVEGAIAELRERVEEPQGEDAPAPTPPLVASGPGAAPLPSTGEDGSWHESRDFRYEPDPYGQGSSGLPVSSAAVR